MKNRRLTLCRSLVLAALVLPLAGLQAQTGPTQTERVDHDIKYLASDELTGREPGTQGIEEAAQFIVREFKKVGVKSGVADGSYRQTFEISEGRNIDNQATHLKLSGPNNQEISFQADDEFRALQVGGEGAADNASLVFVGYGIDAEDVNYQEYLDGLDVNGKIVVMLRMEPQQENADSVFNGVENSQHSYIATKIELAAKKGAVGIIMVNDSQTVAKADEDILPQESLFRDGLETAIPVFFAKRESLEKVLGQSPIVTPNGDKLSALSDIEAKIDNTLEPLSQPISGWKGSFDLVISEDKTATDNVIGVIEGEGPYADETIVIGGHYDHLGHGRYGSRAPGRREIHNGADDNATGTAGVIELARKFAMAEKKPARRLVFIAFSGEERGLLGSRHYVENPVFPLEKTVLMINYDMIGMLRNDKLSVYGVGYAEALDPAADAANTGENPLALNKVADASIGSDHRPFASKQIPVLCLHTGLTDYYHTPEDDYETMNIAGAVRVIDYTEKMIQLLLDAPSEQLKYTSASRPVRVRPSFLGAQFDFGGDYDGLMVNGVTKESPAAKAGLATGDLVVSLNGEKYTTRNEVNKFLTDNKPGEKISIKYIRGGEEVSSEVELSPSTRGRGRRRGRGRGRPVS